MSLTDSQSSNSVSSRVPEGIAVDAPPLVIRTVDAVPVIQITETGGFEAVRAWIREQLPAQLHAIGGRSSRLDLGAREIKLFDLRRLLHLLREEFSVEITGIYVTSVEIQRFAERELKLKLFPLALEEDAAPAGRDDAKTEEIRDAAPDTDEPGELVRAPETPLPEPELLAKTTLPNDLTPAELPEEIVAAPRAIAREPGRRTLTIHRTVRSGTVVRYDGDLFVFGDVNPGANVIASGNITVLGAFKGMAHAGAAGDESAFIFALHLRPTQLRIGRKIALAPDRESERATAPEIASVIGDQIVLEPYKGTKGPR